MRRLIPILAAILLLVALYFILRNRLNLGTGQQPQLTMDLRSLMPTSWTAFGSVVECDLDGDPATGAERLLLYRYDAPAGNPNGGMIGGVVFSSEVNRVPQSPGVTSPYRPAFLIPYKLLPDVYSGKGQGFLGETGATVQFYPPTPNGQKCKADEIYVFGSGGGYGTTRLSIFRWDGSQRRYQGLHFAADGYVSSNWTSANPQAITRVTTVDRFNDRSSLCAFRTYQVNRTGSDPVLLGTQEQTDTYTINFCLGAPPDPAYPEGVVVYFLRGGKPPAANSPTGATFLMGDAVDASVRQQPGLPDFAAGGRAYRILEVRYLGAMEAAYPGQGQPYPTPTGATGSDTWWQAAETATVYTKIVGANGQPVDMTWTVRSIANEQVIADTRWRINRVTSP